MSYKKAIHNSLKRGDSIGRVIDIGVKADLEVELYEKRLNKMRQECEIIEDKYKKILESINCFVDEWIESGDSQLKITAMIGQIVKGKNETE